MRSWCRWRHAEKFVLKRFGISAVCINVIFDFFGVGTGAKNQFLDAQHSNKNARFTFVEIIYININKGPTL
jgi:hypothetical protein